LFLVPHIRTSSYLSLLSEALPSLRSAAPGDIQEEKLPSLRNIVVTDNTGDSNKFKGILDDMKCTIDFREAFVWREDTREKRTAQEIQRSLDKDDVINLQFTR